MTALATHVLRPLDILIVENHRDTLRYLCLFLEQLGHTVRGATSLAAGFEALAERAGDVLICDIGLADGDGWTLLQETENPPAYAIAMSGFGMGTDESRSRAAGFRHHVTKPFTPEQLEGFLQEAQKERDAA